MGELLEDHLPLLSPLILTNIVYSIVDFFGSPRNEMIEKIRQRRSAERDMGSARQWPSLLRLGLVSDHRDRSGCVPLGFLPGIAEATEVSLRLAPSRTLRAGYENDEQAHRVSSVGELLFVVIRAVLLIGMSTSSFSYDLEDLIVVHVG